MVDKVKLALVPVINLVVSMILLVHWRWVSHYLELAAKAARQKRPGLAQRPVCAACEAEAEAPAPVEVSGPPPRWEKKDPRGAKQTIFSTWQFCHHPECVYFGWPKLNNLRANGIPNRGRGGEGQQWWCQACQQWLNERSFTFLYWRRLSLAQVGQVVAEGLSYEAAGRIFKVEPDTVAAWVNQAATHLGQLIAGPTPVWALASNRSLPTRLWGWRNGSDG
jgi:transposase-like protein